MANRKTNMLKRELGGLNQVEKDYMENLANSLLEIQNSAFIHGEGTKSGDQKKKKRG